MQARNADRPVDRTRPLGVMVPLGPYREFGQLVAFAADVAALKIDAFFVEERPDSELDPFVVLASIAQRVPEVLLGALLAIDNGRPPSVLAKFLSGLDVVSGGRGLLAIGGLANDGVADADRIGEAVALIAGMVTSDVTTWSGAHFRVEEAWNTPRLTVAIAGLAKVSSAFALDRLDETTGASTFVDLGSVAEAPTATSAAGLDRSIVAVVSAGFAGPVPGQLPASGALFLRWKVLPSIVEVALALKDVRAGGPLRVVRDGA